MIIVLTKDYRISQVSHFLTREHQKTYPALSRLSLYVICRLLEHRKTQKDVEDHGQLEW